MLAIAFHFDHPILSLFISKQCGVAAAGNMKRITCCAVEDFSCNRPAWLWVFITTNKRSFHELATVWSTIVLRSQRQRAEKHEFIWKRFLNRITSHEFQRHFLCESSSGKLMSTVFLMAHLSWQSCLVFLQSEVWLFFLIWKTWHCKCVTPLLAPTLSQSGCLPPLVLTLLNIPGCLYAL